MIYESTATRLRQIRVTDETPQPPCGWTIISFAIPRVAEASTLGSKMEPLAVRKSRLSLIHSPSVDATTIQIFVSKFWPRKNTRRSYETELVSKRDQPSRSTKPFRRPHLNRSCQITKTGR